MKKFKFLLFVLLFNILIGFVNAQPTEIWWKPTSSQALGSGVNTSTPDAWLPTAFKFDTILRSHPGYGGEYTFRALSSATDIMESMGLNAELAVRSLSFSVSSKLNIKQSQYINDNSISVAFTAIEVYRTLEVDVSTIEWMQQANNLLSDSTKHGLFKDIYGDMFVPSLAIGARVTIFITIKNLSKQERNEVMAELGGSGGTGFTEIEGKASYNEAFSRAIKNNSVDIQIMQAYGITNNQVISNLIGSVKSQSLDIDSFAKMVSRFIGEGLNRTTGGIPIFFKLAPYKTIYPTFNAQNFWSVRQQARLIGIWNQYFDVAAKVEVANEILRKNDYRHKLLKSKADRDTLISAVTYWDQYLDDIAEVYDKCLGTDPNGCNGSSCCKYSYPDVRYDDAIPNTIIWVEDLLYTRENVTGDTLLKVKLNGLIPNSDVFIESFSSLFTWEFAGGRSCASSPGIYFSHHLIVNGKDVKVWRLKIGSVSAGIEKGEHQPHIFGPLAYDEIKVDANGDLNVALVTESRDCYAGLPVTYVPKTYLKIGYKIKP